MVASEKRVSFCSPPTPFFTSLDCRHPATVNAAQYAFARRFLSYPAVGYQQYDLVSGYNLFTPVFESITVNGAGDYRLNLQDLQLKGENLVGEGVSKLGEFIQILNANGTLGGRYYWWNADPSDPINYPASWCDSSDAMIEDVYVKRGEGFYIYIQNGGCQLQSAGAVNDGNLTKTLEAGYNVVGNGTPYEIDLQKIQLKGENLVGEGVSKLGEFIQILNADGTLGTRYYWWNADPSDPINYPASWCDSSDTMVEGITVKPGQAYYIYVQGSGCSYEIESSSK